MSYYNKLGRTRPFLFARLSVLEVFLFPKWNGCRPQVNLFFPPDLLNSQLCLSGHSSPYDSVLQLSLFVLTINIVTFQLVDLLICHF